MAVVATGDPSELDNLCLFEGMAGFEDVNVNDDSSLMALLDDLNEETLVNLLDDDLLAKDLSDFSRETRYNMETDNQDGYKSCTDDFLCSRQHPVSVVDPSEYLVTPVSNSVFDDLDEVASVVCVKKARLDVLEDSDSVEREHARICVLHDHSYATQRSDRQMSSSNSNSDEEGSNSDTGYDTMSSSTSPGRSKSKAELSISTPSTIAQHPLETVVDPVALIDARIKHYMCTREVNLTEEEKETLKAEGLPIPTTLPLTKVEEKALKSVRRKIRNKVAAQESRKRKKEFVQTLEQRVSICDRENSQLKSRVKSLENENRCLLEEVKKLRNIVAKTCQRNKQSKVGTCIMVIVLCFAVFYGGQSPQSLWSGKQSEYTTSSVRSRSLLSTDSTSSWYIKLTDWVQKMFMNEHTGDWMQSFGETCLKSYYNHCVNTTFQFMDHA